MARKHRVPVSAVVFALLAVLIASLAACSPSPSPPAAQPTSPSGAASKPAAQAPTKGSGLVWELWLPPSTTWVPTMNKFFTGLESATNGAVKVDSYMGGTMGAPQDSYQRTLNGVNDIATVLTGITPGVFSMTDLFEYPMKVPSSEKVTRAMHQMLAKGYLDKDFANVKLIGLWANAPTQLYLAKKRVTKLSDFEGLKLRISTEGWSAVTKALGAVPVGAATNDVYSMLQKGTLDGSWQVWDSVVGYKLDEVTDYVNEMNFMTITFALVMNKDSWNKLPQAGKDYLEKNWQQNSLDIAKSLDAGAPDLRNVYLKAGKQIINLEPAEAEKMNGLFAPIWQKWIADHESKGLPAKQALNDFYKALTDQGIDKPIIGYTP